MALCGAAGIWTAFWVVAGRCGQTPNGAAGVRTHIENNVFEFERHGATRRGAALRIRCATPFIMQMYSIFKNVYLLGLARYMYLYRTVAVRASRFGAWGLTMNSGNPDGALAVMQRCLITTSRRTVNPSECRELRTWKQSPLDSDHVLIL